MSGWPTVKRHVPQCGLDKYLRGLRIILYCTAVAASNPERHERSSESDNEIRREKFSERDESIGFYMCIHNEHLPS